MSYRTLAPPFSKKLLLFVIFVLLMSGFSGSLKAQEPAPVTVTISNPTLDWPDFGNVIEVPILLSNSDPDFDIHLYSFYIKYNPEDLAFFGAEPGSAMSLNNWGYFQYFFNEYGSVYLTGATEDWNDPHYETAAPLEIVENDTLAILRFYVFRLEEGNCPDYQISFYWSSCADNIVGDSTFWINQLLSNSVYDSEGNDITSQDTFPTMHGAPDNCLEDSTEFYNPSRGIDFHNGLLQFECPFWVDHRGDVNLNDVPLEVGDFIVFQNFLIYGASAFIKDYDLQLATTDVNSDGLTGTVEDLVFMWQVITGVYPLYGNPAADIDSAHFIQDISAQTVALTASDSPSAIYLVFYGELIPADTLPDFPKIGYERLDDTTRVLYYMPNENDDNYVFGDGILFHYTGNAVLVRTEAANNYRSHYVNSFEIVNESYLCGDANDDAQINIGDPIFLINYIFLGGIAPIPVESGDANCDGIVNLADIVYIINYIFRGGNTPCDTDGDGLPDC